MRITIVTTMRDEGPHLLEWIAYHKAVGITHFLVYSNDCSDGTDMLLDLVPDVTHIRQDAGDTPPQWRALKSAWSHPEVQSADWLICLDCDEFINLANGVDGVPHVIGQLGGDAILLPWRLFGNNGHIHFSDGPTTSRFTMAAPEEMLYPAIGSYFKTLFRREGPFRQFGVHRPKQKNPERHPVPIMFDGSGHAVASQLARNDAQIMNWGRPIARDLVQLNHYSVRSVAEFMVKTARGLPNHQDKLVDLTYWVERNFNSERDDRILNMATARDRELDALLNLPGIREAYEESCRWHHTRFREIIGTPEGLKLFGRIVLAGSSEAPDRELGVELIRAYGAVHGK